MSALTPAHLLSVWESGAPSSAAARGLLLLGLARPQASAEALLLTSVGCRDAWLLSLRETLFGTQLNCLLDCPRCTQAIELDFRVDDIRSSHADSDAVCTVPSREGQAMQFRLPNCADLMALDKMPDLRQAERHLLSLCRLPDKSADQGPGIELSDSEVQATMDAMALLDPQAEILLDVVCPACQTASTHLFDIVGHLWRELDHWARGMLRQVHAIAARYGWSEAHILNMGHARRQVYLDLIGYAG